MDKPSRPFWMPDAQGFVIFAVFFICGGSLAYRMTHPSPVDDKVLDMMLTILFSTALVAIINYLFGSSRSSGQKDDALISAATSPPKAPPAAPVATTTTVTDDKTVTRTEPAGDGK